MFVFGGILVNI